MALDNWKRLYSNTKTNFHEVAIKAIIFLTVKTTEDEGTQSSLNCFGNWFSFRLIGGRPESSSTTCLPTDFLIN
ncbi:hypothetical protein HanXRQr2_Chr13g0613321 [Helianthus annuus]|uniref:Uncharacterized protein n=1 Tax=Helianthus annuus TaxID=4232 RepID=A0A251SWU8_HELAN|nr:hypothetical protein HanXRQr2_Chr13g0613321 [Helianthus annuus]